MGVDLGSTTAKAVVVDGAGTPLGSSTVQMGAVSRRGLQRAVEVALTRAGVDAGALAATVATGYGRRLVPGAARSYTEITCHARGAAALCPGARLVVDVGGQDSKAIAVDEDGLVEEFAMNDRCASGTGRFYEVLARALECGVEDLGPLALDGDGGQAVSTMCATFAETEVVSMLAEGVAPADIAASVHRAVAARTVALVAQVGRRTPVVFTGGVARNPAAVRFLSEALATEVVVPEDPQIAGALGAALLAAATGPGHPEPPGPDHPDRPDRPEPPEPPGPDRRAPAGPAASGGGGGRSCATCDANPPGGPASRATVGLGDGLLAQR